MDLIRAILLKTEAGEELEHSLLESHAATPDIIAYQVALMQDAGLVDARVIGGHDDEPIDYRIFRLTWAGHDFLDATKDSKIWKAAREHVIKPGVSWTFSILVEWLKQQAHERVFGVPTNS